MAQNPAPPWSWNRRPANIVASADALGPDNWIIPCYREMGALLWRGFPLQGYVDNMYGNEDDAAKGRQMPDHYTAKDFKYGSISSPIGTQIAQAVGFAWAIWVPMGELIEPYLKSLAV